MSFSIKVGCGCANIINMKLYKAELKPRALKDLKNISLNDTRKLLEAIRQIETGLQGDVKRLTNHTPEYRLRVGAFRVLFELDNDRIVIYRIRHRKDAYK